MSVSLSSIRAMLLLAFVSCASASETSDSDPLSHFGWFADMAGSCWTGRYPDGKTADTQCYTTQYGRMLRGTIRLAGRHGKNEFANFEGDSIYAWDQKSGKIRYAFWANDGTYGTSEARLEGDLIVFSFHDPQDSSKEIGRSVWRRVDADTFTVTREKKSVDAWKEQFTVTYRRDPA